MPGAGGWLQVVVEAFQEIPDLLRTRNKYKSSGVSRLKAFESASLASRERENNEGQGQWGAKAAPARGAVALTLDKPPLSWKPSTMPATKEAAMSLTAVPFSTAMIALLHSPLSGSSMTTPFRTENPRTGSGAARLEIRSEKGSRDQSIGGWRCAT